MASTLSFADPREANSENEILKCHPCVMPLLMPCGDCGTIALKKIITNIF